MQRHRYKQNEIDFVLKHLRKYESYSEFCNAFNAEFGTNISRGSMSDLCIKRLKYPIKKIVRDTRSGTEIRLCRSGQFAKFRADARTSKY